MVIKKKGKMFEERIFFDAYEKSKQNDKNA